MTTLLVYDALPDERALRRLVRRREIREVTLLPLTYDPQADASLERALRLVGVSGVVRLDSAALVDEQVCWVRDRLPAWSATIGRLQFRGRSIVDWLRVPGASASVWWFSLLSETNPLKTPAFLRMAQIRVIQAAIGSGAYSLAAASIGSVLLARALRSSQAQRSDKLIWVATQGSAANWRERFRHAGPLAAFVRGACALYRLATNVRCAKRTMPSPTWNAAARPLMFVTYFPFFEERAAADGCFRNRYAGKLQDLVEQLHPEFFWLLMPSAHDGYEYPEAVAFAARFARAGTRVAVLESFLRAGDLVRVMLLWLRTIRVAAMLWQSLKPAITGGLCTDALPMIRTLWVESFYGPTAVSGISYYLGFGRVFESFPRLSRSLYFLEMQAWEKAFNAARHARQPDNRSVGFVHTAPSTRHFQYFPDRALTAGAPDSMPLPDVVAANGPVVRSLLEERAGVRTAEVEAVRHLYLAAVPSQDTAPTQANTVLVAGSVDRGEMRSILLLLQEALPVAGEWEVLLKEHPNCAIEPILRELAIDAAAGGYTLCGRMELAECLERSVAVLVPSSTVGLESLSHGCEVIVPVFPDSMLLNPLADFPQYCRFVSTAAGLRQALAAVKGGERRKTLAEYRQFVGDYWFLDETLSRWRRLLRPDDLRPLPVALAHDRCVPAPMAPG